MRWFVYGMVTLNAPHDSRKFHFLPFFTLKKSADTKYVTASVGITLCCSHIFLFRVSSEENIKAFVKYTSSM